VSPPAPTQGTAIAIPYSALFGVGTGVGGGSSSGSGPCPGGAGGGCSGPDPNTLYLEFGTPEPTCSDPQPALGCGNTYGISIGIPPELQHPGVIPLSDPTIISTMFESGPAQGGDPNSCPGGGGSFISGTIVINSIDGASVSFTLSGTQSLDFTGMSVDGLYVATRCY
jgi:hypothetical protein